MTHEKILKYRLSGQLDGPRFADWLQPEAEQRGLDGWVRDRGDGQVDILLAGPEFAVDAVVYLCGQVIGAAGDIVMEERQTTGAEPIWGGFHIS